MDPDLGETESPGCEEAIQSPPGLDGSAVSLHRRGGGLSAAVLLLEALLLLGLFAYYAGTIPPDVNEAHYLGKARHFWMPQWCDGDMFIASSNAHWLFYVTVGSLNLWFELPEVAWIGRIASWFLIAIGWCYCCRGLTPRWGVAFLSGAVFLIFQHFGHLAGEWIVGGVEAKGLAFACVFFGLGRMIRGDWVTSWIWWGLGSAFHVLVGGWVVVAALFTWLAVGRNDGPWKPTVVGLIIGGLLSLIGVVPGLLLGSGVDTSDWLAAQRVYVFERLQHHLVPSSFSGERWVGFGSLVCLWLIGWGAAQRTSPLGRMQLFVIGTLVIAGAGLSIDQYVLETGDLDFGAKYLRFYWFRSADIFVPAAAAIMLTLAYWESQVTWPVALRVAVAGLLAVTVSFGVMNAAATYHGDGRPRADQQSLMSDFSDEGTQQIFVDWSSACGWIRENLPEDAIVFSPRRQQTFKWYAHRSEVANWKDIPQNASGLVRWRQRFEDVYMVSQIENRNRGLDLGLLIHSDGSLVELAREYNANYLMVPRYQWYWRQQLRPVSKLKVIFPPSDASKELQQNYFVVLQIR
jgi:hypothetical protein